MKFYQGQGRSWPGVSGGPDPTTGPSKLPKLACAPGLGVYPSYPEHNELYIYLAPLISTNANESFTV